jgi:ferredoxin
MHVRILRAECCGNGECVETAPGVFALDSKNKAVVLDPATADTQTLIEACEACPCSAIVLEDDDGNSRLPRDPRARMTRATATVRPVAWRRHMAPLFVCTPDRLFAAHTL